MIRPSIIAIDGPVASGKTVVGRLLSQRLGYRFLDTGSMYRAITWMALKRHISPKDIATLTRLAEEVTIVINADGDEQVLANQCDVTPYLRRPEVGQTVSQVSQVAGVRRALVRQQRHLAAPGEIVVVGRDIGTVVLPDADLKLFLRASPEERARRRYEELLAEGPEVSYQQVLEELQLRDGIDAQRSMSPLKPAHDAHLLDTDGIEVEEVVERVLALIQV